MASMALTVASIPMVSSTLSFSRSPSVTSVPLSFSLSSMSLSSSESTPISPLIYCGRGDKKTAKGKRFNHSFGNARPRNKKKGRGPQRVPVPPAPPRKDKFDDVGQSIMPCGHWIVITGYDLLLEPEELPCFKTVFQSLGMNVSCTHLACEPALRSGLFHNTIMVVRW
ncbi:hypothetical protein E3N88_03417 [Mikania micrantha]|uniref:Uncharacterized protein n=1 Tax=Mikania micrantha TaxID=192012 RepID=A0A5N6Q8S4_9ASTR|nr:hypothetical protein E3N88_03417 [Mikania micrantha]